jgi:flagellar FliJ protein
VSRPDRLATLERLAAFEATQAARLVAERQRGVVAEEERLRQLEGYLHDYARRDTTPGVTTVAALTATRRFLDRLREAAGRQREAVRQAREQAEAAAMRFRAARARREALARLRERAAAAAAGRRAQREQRRLDELATTRHGRDPQAV